MKELKIRYLLYFVSIVMVLPSCGKFDSTCINGAGDMKMETRTVSGSFHSIENRTFLRVIIEQGPVEPVEIEAQQNVLDLLGILVQDNVLTVYTDKCVSNASNSVVKITMPDLHAVYLVGTGDIEVKQFTGIANLLIASSGTGRVTFFSELEDVKKVGTLMSGSGEVDVVFHAENFFAEITGSGDLTVGGSVRGQDIFLGKSGNYEGIGLESDSCRIQIAQSGNAKVHVDRYLNVNIGGSGNVTYVGDPTINQIITGDGEVIDGN